VTDLTDEHPAFALTSPTIGTIPNADGKCVFAEFREEA
jgi:hypothetical protein